MRYFAYGSNLDPTQLARREVAFTDPEIAILRDHRLTFNKVAKLNAVPGEGRANVVPARGHRVEGVAFVVPESSLDTLDYYEGANSGHYRRTEIQLEITGTTVDAITYVAAFTRTGLKPSHWYRDTIVRGARHFGLSETYIDRLEGLSAIGPRETPKERV